MFCPKCGAELPDDANFCDVCGTDVREKSIPRNNVSQNGSTPNDRPQRRTRKKPQETEPPPFIMRVILVLCSVIIICVTNGSFLVNLIGKEADAVILSTSINKQLANEKYLYSWDVTYEFYANGKKYVDTDELTGPYGSLDTFGYHVNYLSFAPEISRLTCGPSVSEAHSAGDAVRLGAASVFYFLLGLLVSYFLLWVAFPKLPFFGFNRKKKKNRKKRKK